LNQCFNNRQIHSYLL